MTDLTWIASEDRKTGFGRMVWAIAEADGFDADADYEGMARAALMVIREPTSEMVYAATEPDFHESNAQDKAVENWQAMIDHILQSNTEEGK